MFDLKRPCVNCPFRKGQGEKFCLGEERIHEIASATAFQCHKTVDYDSADNRAGDRPQQCAGLMAVLHREGKHNQIMQVASRISDFDASTLDPENEAYESLGDVIAAHSYTR